MNDINFLKDNGVDVDSAIEILGDMEMFEETLDDFLLEVDERKSKILEYKNNSDMENYAILVHAIKGDSKYLGFVKLADLSYDHQLKSQEGDFDYIDEHYEELMIEFDRVVSVVKKYLGK